MPQEAHAFANTASLQPPVGVAERVGGNVGGGDHIAALRQQLGQCSDGTPGFECVPKTVAGQQR
jgi:hypothetical protein